LKGKVRSVPLEWSLVRPREMVKERQKGEKATGRSRKKEEDIHIRLRIERESDMSRDRERKKKIFT
jgi:hypothetical protein